MGKCSIGFEHGQIIEKKSDQHHSDNDWLTLSWTINDHTDSAVFPLLDLSGSDILDKSSALQSVSHSFDCQDDQLVIVIATVVNFGGVDRSKQEKAAGDFARDLAKKLLELYLTVAPIVLTVLTGAGVNPLGVAISKAGIDVLNKLSDKLDEGIDKLFDDVLTPLFQTALEAIILGLGGRPPCDGPVLCEKFTFQPNQLRDELLTKQYTGPQETSACGNPPQTKVTWWLYREAVEKYEPFHHEYAPGVIFALSPRMIHVPSDHLNSDIKTWDFLWYNHLGINDGAKSWEGPRRVGYRWNFNQVCPGMNGLIYAIDGNSQMQWYHYTGFRQGVFAWTGPNTIGSNFKLPAQPGNPDDLLGIFCDVHFDTHTAPPVSGGSPLQVIYGVRHDGTLLWFAHENPMAGAKTLVNGGAGKPIGADWVATNRLVFSGGNGVIYLITNSGDVLWYKHLGPGTGDSNFDGPHTVWGGGLGPHHSPWSGMVNVFSIGEGTIYGIDQNGDLNWFKHLDFATGGLNWAGPKKVGNEWSRPGFHVAVNSVVFHGPSSPG